jgi:hypothetical protein
MPQAKTTITTPSMLAAIAPNRERFTVINGGLRLPENSTMALIDRIAVELAAKHGAPIKPPKKGPQNPFVTCYGKILDPEKAYEWDMAQRKGDGQ